MKRKPTVGRTDSTPKVSDAAPKPITIPAHEIGLSLRISDEALKEFDEVQESTNNAAEEIRKYSWR